MQGLFRIGNTLLQVATTDFRAACFSKQAGGKADAVVTRERIA
jgi:hypothetical protein